MTHSVGSFLLLSRERVDFELVEDFALVAISWEQMVPYCKRAIDNVEFRKTGKIDLQILFLREVIVVGL